MYPKPSHNCKPNSLPPKIGHEAWNAEVLARIIMERSFYPWPLSTHILDLNSKFALKKTNAVLFPLVVSKANTWSFHPFRFLRLSFESSHIWLHNRFSHTTKGPRILLWNILMRYDFVRFLYSEFSFTVWLPNPLVILILF